MSTTFLPPGYKPPKKESRYIKLIKGDTRLRVLGPPLLGWVSWVTENKKRKPLRRTENTFTGSEVDPNALPKHFWAMPVWDYLSGQVKVWELTQVSIQTVISKLAAHKKWGPPMEYDLVIQATGDGMEREYSVLPEPKEALDVNAQDAWAALEPDFDINRLLEGGDPFGDQRSGSDEFAPHIGNDDDIPF